MLGVFSTIWGVISSVYSSIPIIGPILVLLRYAVEILLIYPLRFIFLVFHPSKEQYKNTLEGYRSYFQKIRLVLGLFGKWLLYRVKRLDKQLNAEDESLPNRTMCKINFQSEEAILGYHLFGFIHSLDEKYRKLLLSQLFRSMHVINSEPNYKKRMANFLFDFFDTREVIKFLMNGWFVEVLLGEYKGFNDFYNKYGSLLKVPISNMVYNHKTFSRQLFSNDALDGDIVQYKSYFEKVAVWGNNKEYRRIRDLDKVGFWAVFSVKESAWLDMHYNLIYRAYCKGQIFNDLLDFVSRNDISTNNISIRIYS